MFSFVLIQYRSSNEECDMPKFPNLKQLELQGYVGYRWQLITQFLERSPKLEHLSIKKVLTLRILLNLWRVFFYNCIVNVGLCLSCLFKNKRLNMVIAGINQSPFPLVCVWTLRPWNTPKAMGTAIVICSFWSLSC